MKFILFYYGQFADSGEDAAITVDGSTAPREMIDHEKLDAFVTEAKGKAGDASFFVREADRFDGQVEVHGEQLPISVILVGSGPAIELVREAYEAVEVEVTDGDLDDTDVVSDAAEDADDNDPFDGNMPLLKERATDLGLQYSPQIGYNNLLARVRGAEKAKEQSERSEN